MKDKSKLKTFLNLAKLMMLFLCCFVGVGFVSGAEIYQFFVRFGNVSIFGIVAFFLVIFVVTYKILKPKQNNGKNAKYPQNNLKNDTKTEISKSSEFNLKMQNFNKISCKNTFLNKNFIKQVVVFLNVFLISSAMLSGLKNLVSQLFYNNTLIVLILCFLALFVLLFFGIKGLEKFDIFVIIFVALIIFVFVSDESFGFFEFLSLNLSSSVSGTLGYSVLSIVFSSLYVFMNIMQIEPICKISGVSFSKKSAFWFSFVFSFVLSLTLFVFVVFLSNNSNFWNESMPFLTCFLSRGGVVSKLFPLGLVFALVSTLVTCLVGVKSYFESYFEKRNFLSFLDKNWLKNIFLTSLTLVLCFLFSLLPFSFYIEIIYPLLGALNLVIYIFC